MPKLTKAESARINGRKSRGPKTPQGRANSSMWRYQTAILDLEVEEQAQEFEKRGETLHANMRDAKAFLAVTDNSHGCDIALRHDIHLTREYRKAMDELRCLRTKNIRRKNRVLQNEPKDLGLSLLNATRRVEKISTEPKGSMASPDPSPNQHPTSKIQHPSL